MRRITVTLAAFVTAIALAPVAIAGSMSGKAQSGMGGAKPPAFAAIDTNGDGAVSEDEAIRAKLTEDMDFAQLDQDGDGQLSKSEYEDGISHQMRKRHATVED